MSLWVNIDEHSGVPSQPRPDVEPPPHWRLDAIAALGRPHHLAAYRARARWRSCSTAGDASDVWTMDVDGPGCAGSRPIRDPHAFWEDTAPAWSPDRRRLAFVEGGWVHVVAAGGGPPRRLVEAGSPQWLDDANVDSSPLIGIGVAACAGHRLDDPWPMPLTPADGSACAPAISADGQPYRLRPRPP